MAKIRDTSLVQANYLAVGVGVDGTKEVLGLWIQSAEGAKFWLRVFTELKPSRRACVTVRSAMELEAGPRGEHFGSRDALRGLTAGPSRETRAR